MIAPNIFSESVGIFDSNFKYILLGQIAGFLLLFSLVGLGIYKLLGKVASARSPTFKIIITIVVCVTLVCVMGFLTDQLDN